MIKGLIGLMESKTTITNLIGSSPMRFYAGKLPQGQTTFPSAAFRVNNNIDTSDFSGPSTYDFAMVDIWWWATTYGETENAYQIARKALEGAKGTFNGVNIDDIFYMPSGGEEYSEELEMYNKHMEIKVAYRRTVTA